MGKFSGLLICSDFDGTLAYRRIVSPATVEAIRYFQDHGGRFTLATGRYPDLVPESVAIADLCNAPLVNLNGSLIYDRKQKRALYEAFVPNTFTDALTELAREPRGLREFMFFPRSSWEQITLSPRQIEEMLRVSEQPLYKVVIHVDDDVSDAMTRRLRLLLGEEFSVCRSWINGIEFNRADSDKGTTARRVANMVGADQMIGVGDYENDLSLIREADVGYAMGNGVDALKAIADRVLDTVQNDGFAKMIYDL